MTDEEHIAELEAQLAARTRRLEDTDAALVACERSRDQAKDALASRTRELRTAEHMWNAAEAALSERMRESQQWHKDFVETVARLHAVEQERDTLIAERADTQTRLMFLQEKLDAIAYWLNIGTAPTPHGG